MPPRTLTKASGRPGACPDPSDSQGRKRMIRQRYGKASRTSLSACLAAGVSISAVLLLGGAAPASAGPDTEPHPAGKTSKNLRSDRGGKGVRGPSPSAGRDQRIRRNSSKIKTRMANMQNAQCQGAKVCNVVQRIVLVVPKNFKKFKKKIRKAMRGKSRKTPIMSLPEIPSPPAVPVPSVPPVPALPPIEMQPAETPAAGTVPAEAPAAEIPAAETRPTAAAERVGTAERVGSRPVRRRAADASAPAAPPLLGGLAGTGLGLVRTLL